MTTIFRSLWNRPLLLLPLPPLFWAGNLVLGRALAGSFPPVSLAVGRWLVALACLLPFVAGGVRAQRHALYRARWIILACGAFGIAGYNAIGYFALQTTPAASVAFLNSTLPLMVPLAAFALRVEKVSARTLVGIAISFIGVAWIVARGEPSTLLHLGFSGGEVLVLVAVANYAVYSVLLRRLPADLDPPVFLAAAMAAGLLVLLPFWIWELAHGAKIPTAPGPLAAVLYIGVFASFLAFVVWNRCVAALGPSLTGASFHLVALFTAVLAFLLLGEPVHSHHIAGAALILAGFGLATFSGHSISIPSLRSTQAMSVFSHDSFADHEQVVFVSDEVSGLRAVIAIHDTSLGPALGGCRMYPYADEQAALRDVLRLSRGMTYKAATAGLELGGGKAVIIGDPRRQKTPELLQAMGRAVDRLGGRYITAEDVGTSVVDFAEVRKATGHVVGLPVELGGSGDPSPTTALGVFRGLGAAARYRWQAADLSGRSVAVQGLGNVGWHLCQLLHEAGASLVVSDVDENRVAKAVTAFSARAVAPDAICAAEVDIFAPCAMGAVLNDTTVPNLRCEIVGGGANNQLAREEHGEQLRARGILYAPDFVINAGGLIRVASERDGYNPDLVTNSVDRIGETLFAIFESAETDGVTTHTAALNLARARLARARTGRQPFAA